MNAPVVADPVIVQTFDEFGFTHLRCALDADAAYAEDWVAEVSYARGPFGGLRVNLHDAPYDEGLCLMTDVAKDELRINPRADLSHLTTHHYENDVLVSNLTGRAA